jgi:hypothetical protein
MEENKKEKVVEKAAEQPKVDDKVGKLKVKKTKMKSFSPKEETYKVDLSKPLKTEKEDAVKEDTKQETADVATDEQAPTLQEVVEEVPQREETVQNEESPVLEEVTDEQVEATEQVDDIAPEPRESNIPDNVQKLMNFMEETGGDINDYVKLNKDYSEMDNQTVLKEYYKQTKPHLTSDEIDFLMEDQFSYDEEVDEDKDIRRKKLALKEQVADAKAHLDGYKSKYYEEIKAGSKLTNEQQKAIDFFNRYNKESEENQKIAESQKSNFLNKTNQVFNDKFKGFEYNVGDKKYRFNVKDANEVKDTQSDINNFVKKFLNKKNMMEDARGYHKGLFTAMNPDAVAKHFYEQGKADAIKDSVAKGKNINVNPRQQHGEVQAGGIKVRVLGDNSNDFKFKIKNRK